MVQSLRGLEWLKGKYQNIFDNTLGRYCKEKFKIRLKDNVTPILCRPKQVSYAFKVKLKVN